MEPVLFYNNDKHAIFLTTAYFNCLQHFIEALLILTFFVFLVSHWTSIFLFVFCLFVLSLLYVIWVSVVQHYTGLIMALQAEEIKNCHSSKKHKILSSMVELIFDNYNCAFNVCLSEDTKRIVRSNLSSFFGRYILDFFICNFVIAPAVISFWRGVWDYSLIYLEQDLLDVWYCRMMARLVKCTFTLLLVLLM